MGVTGCGNKTEDSSDTTETSFDFYITKSDASSEFREYYKSGERVVYMSNSIDEFYIIDGETITLNYYVSNTSQSLDDSIKKIIDQLTFDYSYDDGGTSIYKSDTKDITVVLCNKLEGNRNIIIDVYDATYDYSMCE